MFDESLAQGFDAASLPRSASVGEALANHLRLHIIHWHLKPHDPVSESAVAAAYSVSRAHVREAIRLLEGQHLIRRVPQSGNYVTPVSAPRVREGAFLRLSVELANIRDLAVTVTQDQLDRLEALIKEQEHACQADDSSKFHDLDEAFHQALFDATSRANVWLLLQPGKLHVDRARIGTLDRSSSMRRATNEHKEVFSALQQRNPDKAAAAMEVHLKRIDELLAVLDRLKPEYIDHA